MNAIEALEKLASEIDNEWGSDYNAHDAAARIRNLLPRLRTEERDGKRAAFDEGDNWGVANPDATGDEVEAEAEKRYP